ncbi:MAG: HAMP domain-containing histidine kinase [Coprococcus sp.]|nr:HAMP domain-containing histidine kinase [Coprococcus sp.]
MKIWEKNYVLTMSLLIVILFGGIFIIQQYSFYANLDKCCESSLFNERSLEYALQPFLEEAGGEARLKWYCEDLEKQNMFLQVKRQNSILADNRPFLWEGEEEKDFQIVRNGDKVYTCIANTYTESSSNKVSVIYMEEIGALYETQKKQMMLLLAAAVCIIVILSAILYGMMKRIYAPVSNIAHELRTPLTSIQGYAQYILLGNIEAKDIAFASTQIDEQARHINVLIENLLVMGNLWGGKIEMKQIETEALAKDLKGYFPHLSVESRARYLYGDRALLLSLLRNLASNTCRQGENVSLRFDKDTIILYNEDDHLEEKMLDILNGAHAVPKEKINGKGLGVPLCREIVRMHRWKLKYRNVPEGGLEIRIEMPEH